MLNNKAFTLIELLVSMVILAVALLGLLAGYIYIRNVNTSNLLRDEASSIAQETFEEFRNITITQIQSQAADDLTKSCNPYDNSTNTHRILRQIRNIQYPFGRKYEVGTAVNQVIPVKLTVCWYYKNKLKSNVFDTLIKGN